MKMLQNFLFNMERRREKHRQMQVISETHRRWCELWTGGSYSV